LSHRDNGKLTVYLKSGPVQLSQQHVRQLLEKICIVLRRRGASRLYSKHDTTFDAMPLFQPRDKRQLQQAALMRRAIKDIQEFDDMNNIELRRDFCETKYYGIMSDSVEKRKVAEDASDANYSRKMALENTGDGNSDGDEGLEITSSGLIMELEYIIHLLGKKKYNGSLDLRELDVLVDISQLDLSSQTDIIWRAPVSGGVDLSQDGLDDSEIKLMHGSSSLGMRSNFIDQDPRIEDVDNSGPSAFRKIEITNGIYDAETVNDSMQMRRAAAPPPSSATLRESLLSNSVDLYG
jgi:hypothetical protein